MDAKAILYVAALMDFLWRESKVIFGPVRNGDGDVYNGGRREVAASASPGAVDKARIFTNKSCILAVPVWYRET